MKTFPTFFCLQNSHILSIKAFLNAKAALLNLYMFYLSAWLRSGEDEGNITEDITTAAEIHTV